MNCPTCFGPGIELGSLGYMRHYRCRDCGHTYGKMSKPRKPKPKSAVIAVRKSPWGEPIIDRPGKWLET